MKIESKGRCAILAAKRKNSLAASRAMPESQAKGKLNQAIGAGQDLLGQAADATRETAGSLDQWLRRTIETQPYTTAIVALGIGWLFGRMHRPL